VTFIFCCCHCCCNKQLSQIKSKPIAACDNYVILSLCSAAKQYIYVCVCVFVFFAILNVNIMNMDEKWDHKVLNIEINPADLCTSNERSIHTNQNWTHCVRACVYYLFGRVTDCRFIGTRRDDGDVDILVQKYSIQLITATVDESTIVCRRHCDSVDSRNCRGWPVSPARESCICGSCRHYRSHDPARRFTTQRYTMIARPHHIEISPIC